IEMVAEIGRPQDADVLLVNRAEFPAKVELWSQVEVQPYTEAARVINPLAEGDASVNKTIRYSLAAQRPHEQVGDHGDRPYQNDTSEEEWRPAHPAEAICHGRQGHGRETALRKHSFPRSRARNEFCGNLESKSNDQPVKRVSKEPTGIGGKTYPRAKCTCEYWSAAGRSGLFRRRLCLWRPAQEPFNHSAGTWTVASRLDENTEIWSSFLKHGNLA